MTCIVPYKKMDVFFFFVFRAPGRKNKKKLVKGGREESKIDFIFGGFPWFGLVEALRPSVQAAGGRIPWSGLQGREWTEQIAPHLLDAGYCLAD